MYNKKICHIVGAGSCDRSLLGDWKFKREDLIIAADGGFDTLKLAGIEPDILLGDFDSIGKEGLKASAESSCEGFCDKSCSYFETGSGKETKSWNGNLRIVRLPVEKDYTDMFFAVKEGIAAGYENFFIWGGTGDRFDHAIANLQLLAFICGQGFEGYMIGERENITALSGGFIRFLPSAKGRISVFSHTERSEGVSESGLLYTLEDAVINSMEAIGVSNEFIGIPSEISVRKGILLIMWSGRMEDISERGKY